MSILSAYLKYGFCNKSFRRDEPLSPVEHIFIIKIRFSLSNVLIRGETNFDDKYVEKSVQLVRASSFRNDLLQNPYFNNKFSVFQLLAVIFYGKAQLRAQKLSGWSSVQELQIILDMLQYYTTYQINKGINKYLLAIF